MPGLFDYEPGEPRERGGLLSGVLKNAGLLGQSVYRSAVPVNARILLESISNSKKPITEDDFTPEELEVIRQMHTKNPSGAQAYFDYPTEEARRGAGFIFDSWVDAATKSYKDPAYRMMSTLGGYTTTEDDNNIYANDTYKFDNFPIYKITPDASNSVMLNRAMAWMGSPAGMLDQLMMRYIPEIRRPVNIKIPKVQPNGAKPQ